MKKFKNSTLKKLQMSELGILDKIDELSKKYSFTYWLEFGSAIGAVRHHGFIPWDDDMDIGMLREDYNKLCNIPAKEWGEYELVTPISKTIDHVHIFSQCIKHGTVFFTHEHLGFYNSNCMQIIPNISIDIFVYDYFDPNTYKKTMKKARIYKRLYMYSKVRVYPVKGDSLKTRFFKFGKRCIYYGLYFLGITPEMIYQKFLDLVTSSSREETDMICNFTTMPIIETNASRMRISDYLPLVYLEFETRKYPLPKCYDALLSAIYGNYMELPPEDKRCRKPPIEINFGDGEQHWYK